MDEDDDPQPIPDLLGNSEQLVTQSLPDLTETGEKIESDCEPVEFYRNEVIVSDGEVENELSEDLESLQSSLEVQCSFPTESTHSVIEEAYGGVLNLELNDECQVVEIAKEKEAEKAEPIEELVKFENDPDIADEDLEKLLEQLEDEEKESKGKKFFTVWKTLFLKQEFRGVKGGGPR